MEIVEYCTLDREDAKNRLKIFNAKNNATSLSVLPIGARLHINGVMALKGVRSQTDEVCQNTYLFTDDGQVYFSQSRGIAKVANDIVDLVDMNFSVNTFAGYVVVELAELPTKNGVMKTLKVLEV